MGKESAVKCRTFYTNGRYPVERERVLVPATYMERTKADKNENGQLYPSRSHGRRITEWHKQPAGHYKSGEMRVFIVEKRDKESLSPNIRGNDGNGLIHVSVNHIERFVREHGVHTQNIKREEQRTIYWDFTFTNICGEAGEIRYHLAVFCDYIEAAGPEFP
ncbi:hypothetical protein RF11_07482 [Thelohanellus kitauei]|uniref:Uncharacterized protein n=1 Tax=Thelohanellus kitauei TaxID=669202 RepID=A0A0C2J8G7_THEKT|nr:hypothetical protein RF11_07482 [Thelohanellus kitauei]